jgi:hypothetical protein
MWKSVLALALAGFVGFVGFVSLPAQERACLHGPKENPEQRGRRMAALEFARQLNTLEAAGKSQAQRYYAIEDLPGLPPLPKGFKAANATDGASYTFSIKDTLDACHFAFFSDQDGLIYTATPIS